MAIKPNNTTAKAIAEPAEVAPKSTAPTTARKPREKVRPIEVLMSPETSIKTMSDREKTLLIEHLTAELSKYRQQTECYRRNAEEAFKKAQLFEDAANKMADKDNAKFNDIIQAVSMLYKTVYLIAKDGTSND